MSQKRKQRDSYSSFNKWHWLILAALFVVSILLVDLNVNDFKASVISTQTAPAFNGTVYPVSKTPIWTSLSSEEWKLPYSGISAAKMQDTPLYNAQILAMPSDQLSWTKADDLNVRNSKITFSVPYMGNYKLDGIEGAGSHLAVDIKVPMDTPVYAIANGIVDKTSLQSTGFGHHIVIRHDNVPSLENPSLKTTYYSSYSHLDEVLVAEGSVVLKGQFIGKSGSTGTASTPHVHFQIDNSNAPWHPYWPFTMQEAYDAGLNFNSAIDFGLGKEKAIATTINPLLFVQKYLDQSVSSESSAASPGVSSASDLPPAAQTVDVNTTPAADPAPEVTPEVTAEVTPEKAIKPATKFELTHSDIFTVGVPEKIFVKALDEDNNVVSSYKPGDYLYVKVIMGGASVPKTVAAKNFENGTVSFEVTPTSATGLQLEVKDESNISGQSKLMQNVMFHDVDTDASYANAVSFLKEHGVITGYPDGTFRPDVVISRVEALKFILGGVNSDLISALTLPFPDTVAAQWYSDYVVTAYNLAIVGGYPDSTFKPSNTVNRAEFLKMLLLAMEINVDDSVTTDVYSDVPKDEWFAPYVKYAKDKNLVTHSGGLFKPNEGMSRSEVAELIYRVIVLKISGGQKYSSGLKVSENDVTAYFI